MAIRRHPSIEYRAPAYVTRETDTDRLVARLDRAKDRIRETRTVLAETLRRVTADDPEARETRPRST